MSAAVPNVLIVGCGLTGAALARAIVRSATAAMSLTVWDKSRGAGGRFNTHRSDLAPDAKVDTGAQYITKGVHYPDILPDEQLYSELLLSRVLQPFSGVIEGDKVDGDNPKSNYVAPGGLSSVVRHLVVEAGAALAFAKRVVDLSLTEGSSSQQQRWLATCDDGSSGAFDAVVVTLPVPQILALEGSVAELLKGHRSTLEKVEYSSRYAMAAYFDDPAAAAAIKALPFTAKYVKGDECLRYLSLETRKQAPNKDSATERYSSAATEEVSAAPVAAASGCQALLLHTSVPYAPAQTKLQKWRYSQVRTPFEGSPGALLVSEGGEQKDKDTTWSSSQRPPLPPLLLAGDGFSKSAFDGCAHSAAAAARLLLEKLPP